MLEGDPPFPYLTGDTACGIRLATTEYRQPKALNRTSMLESGASESPPMFRLYGGRCCEVGASAWAEWTGELQAEKETE
jgi:hypothetical protein